MSSLNASKKKTIKKYPGNIHRNCYYPSSTFLETNDQTCDCLPGTRSNFRTREVMVRYTNIRRVPEPYEMGRDWVPLHDYGSRPCMKTRANITLTGTPHIRNKTRSNAGDSIATVLKISISAVHRRILLSFVQKGQVTNARSKKTSKF